MTRFVLWALVAAGCSSGAADRQGLCADVGDARVCWSSNESPPRVGARLLPAGPAPEAGWRCDGRTCVDRARGGGPFTCDGDRCRQTHPRLPDDGEWECADLDGAVVCHGGAPPAGVVTGPPDLGWICGARSKPTDAGASDRVCVDFAPDLPKGASRGYACTFDRTQGGTRTCTRLDGAPKIGAACTAAASCPRGARCVSGRCLPPRPAPDCWVDPDCGSGRVCVFGTCAAMDGHPR